MRFGPLALLVPSLAVAQQPVAPLADEQARSQQIGSYEVSNLLEAGYRFARVGGDHDLYRAGVNYGNGMRLFNGRFRATSLDRRGLLDELSLVSTGGLADPYQFHTVRAERTACSAMTCSTARFATTTACRRSGGASTDCGAAARCSRTKSCSDRGGRVEGVLGLDLNRRSGPGFASEAIPHRDGGFDARNFLRYRSDLEQNGRQYRAGLSARFFGLALTVIQAVDLYEEVGTSVDASLGPSLAPNIQPVESLSRSAPFHGRTPITTVALRSRESGRLGIAARFVHSGGYRNSTLMQNLAVPDPAASAATVRDTFVVGDANRKQGSGEVTVTFLASSRLALTNTTSFHNTRIDGQAAFLETGLFRDEFIRFDHLGIRRLSNASEATFRPSKQISVFGAHRVSDRRVRAREATRFPDFEFGREVEPQDNRVRSAAGGFRWLPAPGVRASVDFEVGRADRPLTATSERRFHNESARIRWRRGDLTLGGFYRNRVNDNPTELLAYSSKSRSQGAQATWVSPDSGTVLDVAYNLLKMDVSTGVLNLFDLPEPARPRSQRLCQQHSCHVLGAEAGADGSAHPVAEVFLHQGHGRRMGRPCAGWF